MRTVMLIAAMLFAEAPDAGVTWGAIVLAIVGGVTSVVTLALNQRHDGKIKDLEARNRQCEADREQDRQELSELTARLNRHEQQAKRRRKRASARFRQQISELQNQLATKKDATDGHTPLPG